MTFPLCQFRGALQAILPAKARERVDYVLGLLDIVAFSLDTSSDVRRHCLLLSASHNPSCRR